MQPDFPFRPRSVPFFYGWVILVVSTLGIVMSMPGQTMGVSVFTDHLLAATGLSRLEVSNAYLVGTLLSALALPWGGQLVDRFGARRVVLGACLGLAVTLVYLASSDRIARGMADVFPPLGRGVTGFAVLALGFTALRFSGQGMLTLVSRTMLARWFHRGRGVVAALSGPFVSFAMASSPLILSVWIGAAGWRGAWLGMAVVVGAGMGLVGWLFYRDTPEECGLVMYGAAPSPASDSPSVGVHDYRRGEALRTAAFWLVTLGIANHAMVGTGFTFHIVDIGAEMGVSEARAVAIFLPSAVVSALVGLAVGLAVDRVPIRFLILVMLLGQVVLYAGMASFGEPLGRGAVIAGWGLAGGFYGPLMLAALPGFFGRTHLGAIQGVQMMVIAGASALGPTLLATFERVFGSYRPGLLAVCSLPLLVAAVAPWVPDPQRKAAG